MVRGLESEEARIWDGGPPLGNSPWFPTCSSQVQNLQHGLQDPPHRQRYPRWPAATAAPHLSLLLCTLQWLSLKPFGALLPPGLSASCSRVTFFPLLKSCASFSVLLRCLSLREAYPRPCLRKGPSATSKRLATARCSALCPSWLSGRHLTICLWGHTFLKGKDCVFCQHLKGGRHLWHSFRHPQGRPQRLAYPR